MTLLDEMLPRWDEHERHGVRAAAPAGRLLAAALEVTPAEAPLLRGLFAIRGLPARAAEPIWEQMLGRGFRLLGEARDEVVAGAIGRPWRVWERLRRDDVFETFGEPGYVKMAMGFLVRDARAPLAVPASGRPGSARSSVCNRLPKSFELIDAGAELVTETRILATDDAARRAFAPYWLVVKPASGLTRRSWLAAAARRAATPTSAGPG
jgi:hypothetical protein